jgi:hypothetical protein
MDTFPIVCRKDEQQFGTYRTKEMILVIYDAMAEASRTGEEYRSLLEPPPGDLRVSAFGNRVSTRNADRMRLDERELEAAKNGKIVTPELGNDPEELTVVLPAA